MTEIYSLSMHAVIKFLRGMDDWLAEIPNLVVQVIPYGQMRTRFQNSRKHCMHEWLKLEFGRLKLQADNSSHMTLIGLVMQTSHISR